MMRMFPSAESIRPRRVLFSTWDLLVIPLVLVLLYLLTVAFRGAMAPFGPETPDLTVSLDPVNLPYYGLRTMFRMFLAVLLSLAFTLTYATLAAKSRRAERVLIPILDFLQSLPILGFLTVTTTIFLGVFQGSLFGLEAASVFAIFTSQVWNMAFSFYQSLITVPQELKEAAAAMRLSSWQKFWKLEVPFAMPALVWNTMMSVSGGWFFVVASEVISVVGRDSDQALPGVGAYMSRAIEEANLAAMVYAGITLLVLVLIYDQLIFRPIVAWAEKFKFEQAAAEARPRSWALALLRRSLLLRWLTALPAPLGERLSLATSRRDRPGKPVDEPIAVQPRAAPLDWLWNLVLLAASVGLLYVLAAYMFRPGPRLRGRADAGAEPKPQCGARSGARGALQSGRGRGWGRPDGVPLERLHRRLERRGGQPGAGRGPPGRGGASLGRPHGRLRHPARAGREGGMAGGARGLPARPVHDAPGYRFRPPRRPDLDAGRGLGGPPAAGHPNRPALRPVRRRLPG